MLRSIVVVLAVLVFLSSSTAFAAGDFPVASCKSWNGTVVERSGADSAAATMKGTITKADVQEYCERDPGGETKKFNGKLTTEQCAEKYYAEQGTTTLSASANCNTGTIEFRYGTRQPIRAQFPLGRGADSSCASGIPPLLNQFKMLCPRAAARMGLP
jgi:hypothetical protein